MSETTDTGDAGEEFTELYGGNFGRVDLVHKGANGIPFLIAKSDAADGLMPADLVRGLIEPEPGVVIKERDDVTFSGSPTAVAAIMAQIHEAALRSVAKGADATPDHRAETGAASTTDPQEGHVSKHQESGEMADVAKADGPNLEVGDVVADAGGGSTADTVPGSPDWEQRDADTALNAISVLGRVKSAIEFLSGREATEAVTGADPDDADSAMCLDGLADQVDAVIRQLAGFAAGEALEVEQDGEMDDVVKAMQTACDAAEHLLVLERLAPVVKAGRVLSSANETAIRQASESLQKVLSSLPAAPTADEPVAKEKEPTVDDTTPAADAAAEPVEKADAAPVEPAEVEPADEPAEVEKAKGDPQLVVFDQSGNAIGIVDPKNLVAIAKPGGDSASSDASPDEAASADPTEGDDGDAAAADDAAKASADDAGAAAPAADAGDSAATIPGTDTVQAPAPTTDQDEAVTKATQSALAATLGEVLTPLLDRLSATAGLEDVVKGLKERVEHLAAMPDDRKSPMLLNGQIPGGVAAGGADPLVELRKAVDEATTPTEREAARQRLAFAAVKGRFQQ
jgi:hypothetical protein